MNTNQLPCRYPIGIQDFEKLRTEGYAYVDKTAQMYRLIQLGNPFFLSRPRRFGKSLMISTLEAYFRGKKELFKGLYIETVEKDWKEYPVLHLDLNIEKYTEYDDLQKTLERQLSAWEKLYQTDSANDTYSGRFIKVIEEAYNQTGLRVVVLIDEYDKPLLRTFDNEELQDQYRKLLTAFYTVLKTADKWLQFVFITGVTKFAQVGIFSNLNQLLDISFDARFADLCGLTLEEIEQNFSPGLDGLAVIRNMTREQAVTKLTKLYDGYHFSPYNMIGIFNPFGVLKALSTGTFDFFWFASGTPTFLAEMLKKTDVDLRNLDGIEITSSELSDDRADAQNPVPMIYQSGYLTIKSYNERFRTYTLTYPNDEVKYGFLNFIAPFYSGPSVKNAPFYINHFIKELESGQVDAFLTRLRSFFADFPYELNEQKEKNYHIVFYLVFKLMGQYIGSEVHSARGRADAVVKTNDYIYVFEFKLNGTARQAIEQINDKGYPIPYAVDGRKLFKVGVSFDAQTRNLDEWIVEE